jgi:hypothetical protein
MKDVMRIRQADRNCKKEETAAEGGFLKDF